MAQDIFEEIGKRTPYIMPQTINFEAMMEKALTPEKKGKSKFAMMRWLSASAAAVAAVILVITFTSSPAVADPAKEYNAAVESFCNNASNEQMEMQIDMADADIVPNMDDYGEYYY